MGNADVVFAGSIPEFYDTYMVPLIFEPYAVELAARVAALSPMAVLETAAGTGVVPRALIGHLHPEARYVVTDLNEPMLQHAAGRQGADDRIEWRQADALDLPFGDASFDVVICQYGAMFFPDRSAGYAEARRVLKPGGRYIVSVWDRIETSVFADVVSRAVASVFPDDPPQFMARTPHGYYDHDVIREDMGRAGFTDVTIETVDATSRARSARQVAMAFCQGTPLRGEIEKRDPQSLDRVTEVATAAVQARFGSGAVSGGMRAHVVTAVR